MDERADMRLTDYAQALRRWWRIVLVGAVLGAVIGALLISPQAGGDEVNVEVDVLREVDLADAGDGTSVEQVAGELLGRLDRLSTGLSTDDIVVTAVPGSRTIRLTGSGQAAESDLMEVAESFVAERRNSARDRFERTSEFFRDQVGPIQLRLREIEDRLNDVAAEGGDTVSLQTQLVQTLGQLTFQEQQLARNSFFAENANGNVADPVMVELRPESSSRVLGAVFGLVLGALTGAAYVVVRAHLDRRVRTARQLDRVIGPTNLQVVAAGAPPGALGPFAVALMRTVAGCDSQAVAVVGVGETSATATERVAAELRAVTGDQVCVRNADGVDDVAPARVAVLVLRSGGTEELELAQAVDSLRMREIHVGGAVLVDVPLDEFTWAYGRAPATPVPA